MAEHAFWTRLAEHPLWIQSGDSYMEELFSDYKIEPMESERQLYYRWYGKRMPLTASEKEIQQVKEELQGAVCSQSYLESLVIYNKIAEQMPMDHVLLFHCSALTLDGKAYLFTAPSGTGKSTHAGLWRQVFGERVVMINDDKPLLYVGEEEIKVYGTPYSGKEQLHTNTSAPVAGIVVLHQAPENGIQPLNQQEAFLPLLLQAYRPNTEQAMHHTIDMLKQLSKLPIFRLDCTISREAVMRAYHALCQRQVNGENG